MKNYSDEAMKASNNKKDRLLKMSHGKAVNQLRKMVLFKCIKKLGEDICFRCGEKIESINDLSIEHKLPWQSSDDPIETFFDLENIAFSHLNCNISASDKTGKRNKIGETGFKGVSRREDNLKNPYRARAWENGKSISLGNFETPEKANEIYNKYLES